MYSIVTIGGQDYKVEYTLEASMYKDFVEKLTRYTMTYSGMIAKYDVKGKGIKDANELLETSVDALTEMMVSQTTQIPELTKLGFYAGLMEHQKLSSQQAYDLYKQYMIEYNKKPVDVLADIMNKVKDDNFFALIGLDMTKLKETNKKSTPKKNHTKKA